MQEYVIKSYVKLLGQVISNLKIIICEESVTKPISAKFLSNSTDLAI